MDAIIPTAVQTTRAVLNTDIGVDANVTTFEISENKKVLYHVVVVTNANQLLTRLRNADSSKESFEKGTTVHFTIKRYFQKCTDLRNSLDEKYSGTFVPQLQKQGANFSLSASVLQKQAKQNMKNLNTFLTWCTSSGKIAFSPLFLRFLGLNPKVQRDLTNPQEDTSKPSPLSSNDLFNDDNHSDDDLQFLDEEFNKQKQRKSDDLFSIRDDESTYRRRGLFEKPVFNDDGNGDERRQSGKAEEASSDDDSDVDLASIVSKLKVSKSKNVKDRKHSKLMSEGQDETSDEFSTIADENDVMAYIAANSTSTDNLDLGF